MNAHHPVRALAVTVEPDRRGPSGLAYAFLVALALHVLALVGMALFGAAPTAPPARTS